MNRQQRMWLVASLVFIGLALPFSAFTLDDEGPSVVVFYTTPNPNPLHRGPPVRHGIFVRYAWWGNNWSQAAILWGGIVPLGFFAAAGFIWLGRDRLK